MAKHPQISIEVRTTWVLLAMNLCGWLKSKWLLKLLNGAILYRTYRNNKLLSAYRLDIKEL